MTKPKGDAFTKILRREAAHCLRMSKQFTREKAHHNAANWMVRHLTIRDVLAEYEVFKGFKTAEQALTGTTSPKQRSPK